METIPYLDSQRAHAIAQEHGTPVFVYDQKTIEAQADKVLAFPHAFGYTARYAMKALPSGAVLRILHAKGVHIDASSGFEVERAMQAGFPASHIMLTAQELPSNFDKLVNKGVIFNACSLHQMRAFGERFHGAELCVRINPGLGSGHSNRTNVGGPSSSFGIWHEHLDEVLETARHHNITVRGMHTHIGSGSDPEVWVHCAQMALDIAARLPDVQLLSLGGGHKVGRMPDEPSADLQAIGARIVPMFEKFAEEHGHKLHLELEPGTYYVANAGALLTTVMDVADTGNEGYQFIKVDGGMTEILRPSLYGAQHPMALYPSDDDARGEQDYLIAGHCCESGDILTPEPGNPEGLNPHRLPEARIGDLLVIGGAGAYCAAMSAKNYNSFPEAPEVLIHRDGAMNLIRRRQTLEQVMQNEL